MIKIDELVKMKGQSLNGRKSTLKPVNRETTDSAFSTANEIQYTSLDIVWL